MTGSGMLVVSIILALVLGAGLSTQVGVNASLRSALGHPVYAAIVNFSVGLTVLVALTLAARIGRPPAGAIARTSWWMYFGGVIGSMYVFGVIVLAPRLGAAVLMSLVVTGQLLAALLLDHFGALGFPRHTISPVRAVGAFLLVMGVVLVRRG
jgi:bacterial/archaeal transporter family-2 protein